MQHLVLSTDDVPEGDRFAYWRDAFGETWGVSVERSDESDVPFEAGVVASIGRSVTRVRCRGCRHPVFRRCRDVARHGWDNLVWVHREIGEGSWFRHGGREYITRPGDLIVSDAAVLFEVQARNNYHHHMWFFPRTLFDPHLSFEQRPRSVHLSSPSGVNSLVLGYLDAFDKQLDTLSDNEAQLVTDNFCRLLAVACGGAAGEHRAAIASARLEEAKRYIALHLADRALTPEKAAATLKLSVRQLHRLFEPTGTSFSHYVLQCRLEECRSALVSPTGVGRSVTDIALGLGFNSLPTFYRAFQRAYGMTPNELRAACNRNG